MKSVLSHSSNPTHQNNPTHQSNPTRRKLSTAGGGQRDQRARSTFIGGVALTVLLGLAATAFFGGCGTATDGQPSSAPAQEAPQTNADPATVPFARSEALLIEFAESWSNGDWDRMRLVAEEDVVRVAQEHYEDGDRVMIEPALVGELVRSCSARDIESRVCEVLYGDHSEPALIFEIVLTHTADSSTVSALTFAGDTF